MLHAEKHNSYRLQQVADLLVTRFHCVFNFYHKHYMKSFSNQFLGKEPKKFLIFVMFTLASILSQYHCCFVLFAGLINMPWLHSLKTRREQQKEPDYLKKVSIISGIPVKNLFKKIPLISGAIFRKCVEISFSIYLQLC